MKLIHLVCITVLGSHSSSFGFFWVKWEALRGTSWKMWLHVSYYILLDFTCRDSCQILNFEDLLWDFITFCVCVCLWIIFTFFSGIYRKPSMLFSTGRLSNGLSETSVLLKTDGVSSRAEERFNWYTYFCGCLEGVQ